MKPAFKQVRERSGLTQTETANELGMTLGNYQKYEYGTVRSYPHKFIETFCNLFNCEPNDLFIFEDQAA